MKVGLLPPLAVAVGASLWGLYWLPVREIEAAGVGGVWAVALFNAPAFAVAAIVFAARPTGRSGAMAMAGAMAGLGLALYAAGFIYTSVVRATLLFYLTPVWSTLIAMVVLGERPGAIRWAALAAALLGLALILGPGAADGGFGIGEAFGLSSGVAWALASVLIRRAGGSGAGLVFYQFAAVIGAAAIIALAMGAPAPDLPSLTGALTPFVIALSLAICASVYVIFWAVAKMSPGRSGLLMMSEVVVAVLSAAILLPEETLSPTEWLGAALIVGAGAAEVFGGQNA